jgi:hypothetical protein
MTLADQLNHAIAHERIWFAALRKTDTGSYCESEGHDCKTTRPVLKAYQGLVDALMAFQRSGLKEPA